MEGRTTSQVAAVLSTGQVTGRADGTDAQPRTAAMAIRGMPFAISLQPMRIATYAPLAAILLGCTAEPPDDPTETTPPVEEEEPEPEPSEPAYAWARMLSGPSEEDEIDAVTSDHEGNAILSGKFEASLTIEGSPTALTSAGMADIMVAKYSPAGDLRWSRRFGGPGEDNVFDADTDSTGNIYLSGYFAGTVDFGGTALTSVGNLDMFVVKLGPDGNTLWALRAGGPADDGGNEITVSSDGVITVVAGSGGDFSVANVHIPYSGTHQYGIVMRIDTNGGLQWATHVASASTGGVRLKCLAVDGGGNVYAGGDYGGAVTAHGVNRSEALPTPRGALDAFVTAWTTTGQLRWSKGWGGTGADLCKGIATTDAGDLYAVGYASDGATFDGASLPIVGRDLYVWKLTSAGASTWLVQVSSTADMLGAEVVLAPDGGVMFGHDSAAAVTYGSTNGQPLTVDLPTAGVDWPLLVGYTPAGVPRLPLLPATNTGDGHMDEITRSGRRAYIDVPIFGGAHEFGDTLRVGGPTKDALLVAIDL